jgi:hypothetical protein
LPNHREIDRDTPFFRLTLIGLASWAKFSRPSGTEFGNDVFTRTLEALFMGPENLPNFQSSSIF